MKLNFQQKIYLFGFFYMFLSLIPVIIPFFQSYGLSMTQIFQLQALFGIGVVLFEVPTGYFADLYGRKTSLLCGAIFSSIGFFGFIIGKSFWHFAIVEIIISLGMSFVSGSDQALLYDSLPRDDRKKTASAFANLQLSEQIGESVAALLGGFIATISLVYSAWLQFIASLVVIIIALTIKETKRKITHSHHENFKKVFREIFQGDPLLRWIFINSVLWGLATFFAVWTYQKHWQEIGIPLAYYGVIWAIYNISTGFFGKLVHNLEHIYGSKKILLLMGILPSIGYFALGSVPGFISILFGLCHYISRGINGVMMTDALNWRLNSEFRATAGSLKSFSFRLGFALFGPLVGYSIDHISLKYTYFILGLVFLLAVPLFLWPLIKAIEKIGKSEIPNLGG